MINRKFARANARHVETVRDLMIVSSFGFWAFLLGLAPVLAINLLGGR